MNLNVSFVIRLRIECILKGGKAGWLRSSHAGGFGDSLGNWKSCGGWIFSPSSMYVTSDRVSCESFASITGTILSNRMAINWTSRTKVRWLWRRCDVHHCRRRRSLFRLPRVPASSSSQSEHGREASFDRTREEPLYPVGTFVWELQFTRLLFNFLCVFCIQNETTYFWNFSLYNRWIYHFVLWSVFWESVRFRVVKSKVCQSIRD